MNDTNTIVKWAGKAIMSVTGGTTSSPRGTPSATYNITYNYAADPTANDSCILELSYDDEDSEYALICTHCGYVQVLDTDLALSAFSQEELQDA